MPLALLHLATPATPAAGGIQQTWGITLDHTVQVPTRPRGRPRQKPQGEEDAEDGGSAQREQGLEVAEAGAGFISPAGVWVCAFCATGDTALR